MSRIEISQVGVGGGDGVICVAPNDGSRENSDIGIKNPAMDPAELNVYGLYTMRNSVGCAEQSELKSKSSTRFTYITR